MAKKVVVSYVCDMVGCESEVSDLKEFTVVKVGAAKWYICPECAAKMFDNFKQPE